MNSARAARSVVIAGTILGATSAASLAAPLDYELLTTIPVPATAANNQGGAFTGFDISYVDAATGFYYVADRSNASVDIVNGATLKVVAQAGGFTGQQATTSVSGPDGVLVAGTGASATLFAGNGGSQLRSFNVSNPANPTAAFAPISTGGTFRVDEMSYSPTAHLLLVANNADSPAFATLVNTTNGAIVQSNITIPGSPASGGLEQSVWNPHTGTFFVSVPAFNGGSDPGGLAEISTTGQVLRTFHFANFGISSCSPTGLAVGGSGHLMVGCGNGHSQTIVFDQAANGGTGALVTTIAAISGSDELWYDPASGHFFVTGTNAASNRVFDVIDDATDTVLDSTDLPNVNAHSIAVDPFNGDAFVPLEGTTPSAEDPLCPDGCIAVFAPSGVPEPASLPLLAFGLLGLAGASRWHRRGQARSARAA